jgi:tRNA(Ile)-lysidine synthase
VSQLLEKVYAAITGHELAKEGDTVIAAVSGGPDSVCLLHALYLLSGRLGIKLHAIHINHMLRGCESDADERYTTGLCRKLGIPLHAVPADVGELSRRRGLSLEEAGREARYAEFEKYAAQTGAAAVAVAHNRNDQAETVLMHILRGSGLSGLSGMEYRRGRIIRPLLEIDRTEIDEYCREHGLEPRTDSTNLEDEFTRNRVRLNLIPYIDSNFDTDITGSLCRLSRLAGLDGDYLEKCAGEEYGACLEESGGGFIRLKLDALRRLHPAILGRVLRLALHKLTGSLKGIESIHVDILSDMILKGVTGPVVQLPRNIRAGIFYGVLKIYLDTEKKPARSFSRRIEVPGLTAADELACLVKAEVLESPSEVAKYGKLRYNSMVQLFDYALLKEGINIRNRAAGDIIKPYKSGGTKKLKEFFIDSKIPRDIRDEIPVVAIGNEIVWVAGYKISDKFKVTENTKSILKLEIFKNNATTGG